MKWTAGTEGAQGGAASLKDQFVVMAKQRDSLIFWFLLGQQESPSHQKCGSGSLLWCKGTSLVS